MESIKSALHYDATVPLARLFLAAALEKSDATKEAKDRESSLPQRAAFLRRYDLDALAREAGRMKLAALWVRAANHLLELPPETKIGVGPKVTAREEAARAARTSIGDDAFYGCESLTYCRSLAGITIPDSATSIGDGTFGDCASLAAITVAAANSVYSSLEGVLFNKSQTDSLLRGSSSFRPHFLLFIRTLSRDL